MHRHYLDLGINLNFWTARCHCFGSLVNTFTLIHVPSCFILMQLTLRVLLVCICTKSRMLQADALGWEDIIGNIYCTSKVAWTVNDYHWNSRRSACQELIFLFYLNTCRGISEGKNYFLETAVLICCVDLNSSLFLYSRSLRLRAPPCFWHLQFVISQCGWEGGSWKNIGIDL